MDPAKVRIFQLKAEVLKLANRIVSQDGTGNVEIYVLSRDDLEREGAPSEGGGRGGDGAPGGGGGGGPGIAAGPGSLARRAVSCARSDSWDAAPSISRAAESSPSFSGVVINAFTSDSFDERAAPFLFGNMMVNIPRRSFTSMLQSLLRTAACTRLSVATGGGLGGRPRGFGSPPAEPAALGRPPLSIVSELLPTQSARRRVPPSQAAKMLLMSESCFQFPFLPGKTGVH